MLSMRILLVSPYFASRTSRERGWPSEPLGLLYLATVLHERSLANNLGLNVKILNCMLEGSEETFATPDGWRSGQSDSEYQASIEEFNPQLVGISCNYTFGALNTYRLASLTKKACPSAAVIIGGAHATLEPESVLRQPGVDCVVVGEGERAIVELVALMLNGDPLPQIKTSPPIEDLDSVPIPSRSFIDYSRYLAVGSYFATKQSPVGTVFTSRGCMFRCAFCSTQVAWGNHWRGRSALNMMDEVLYLRDEYGVKEIAFQDDQLLGSVSRMEEFCALATDKKIGMTFIAPPGLSPGRMNHNLLRLMRDAGFYRLCFSVDVGNEKAAKWVKKPVKLNKMRSLVRKANTLGLWTYGTFVIGFPTETKADILETVRYAYGLGLDFLRFYIAQPHAGTTLHAWYIEHGLLPDSRDGDHSILEAQGDLPNITARDLEAIRNKAEVGYLRYYLIRCLNPVRWSELLPKVLGMAKVKYFLKLLRVFNKPRITYTRE